MSKIVFFNIPAYGHTNPTIEVVRELCNKGSEVWYYSFSPAKKKIEGAGAKFIEGDKYLPEFRPEDEKKVGKDFTALIEMIVDTTLAMDKTVCRDLSSWQPDCIISDSLPQHSEEGLVAKRVVDLGAGIPLRKNDPNLINKTIQELLTNKSYKEKARKIGRDSGGVVELKGQLLLFLRS